MFVSGSVVYSGLVTTYIILFLGRPERSVPGGLLFYPWRFFRQPHLQGPSADRRETLPHIGIWFKRSRKFQKFGVAPLKNIRGQKNAKFRSIFGNVRLWLRISPERLKISDSKRDVFYIDSSCVLGNRSRELWSTNFRDFDVRLDPLKCTFWGYYNSALRGCCALKFLHTLEIDQGYLAHTPTGTGVPQKNFNREN